MCRWGCSSYTENDLVCAMMCKGTIRLLQCITFSKKKMLYLHDFPVFSERQKYIVVYNKWTYIENIKSRGENLALSSTFDLNI